MTLRVPLNLDLGHDPNAINVTKSAAKPGRVEAQIKFIYIFALVESTAVNRSVLRDLDFLENLKMLSCYRITVLGPVHRCLVLPAGVSQKPTGISTVPWDTSA